MRKKAALAMTFCVFAFGMIGCQKPATNVNTTEATTAAVEEPTTAAPQETEETSAETTEAAKEEETTASEAEYPTLPLPEYHYNGPEDWAEYADGVSHFLVENSFGDVAPDLTICVPIVLKADDSDPKDVKLWGEFYIEGFNLVKTSLLNVNGGSFGGVAHLDTTKGGPIVTDFDFLQDGSGFEASLDELFGKEGLKDAYLEASNERDKYLAEALANYINTNGLYITQYQEYGWPPVPVLNAPPTKDEDQIVDYEGSYDYTAKFDMREICSYETGESDMFCNVESEDWNEFLIVVYKAESNDLDSAITELRAGLADENAELERKDDITFLDIEGCTLLMSNGPYKEGDQVYVNYFVPRGDDLLVLKISSTYSEDEKIQVATDDIIEDFIDGIKFKG